nr:spry domain protein [uncultured Mediterranean phage uvMED]
MPLILGTNSIKDTGYDVANSCRFNSASNDHLNRTQTAGNRRKFTFSTWVKRCKGNSRMALFLANRSGSNYDQFFFQEDGIIEADFYHSGTQIFRYKTTALYRDPSAWYHVMLAVDTEHSSASSRVRIYVNGLEVTSFATETNPSQDVDTHVNENGIVAYIGSDYNSNEPDYYLAETVMLDGTQATPTDFGEFDEDSGIWKPIDVSGLTFGNNGFYLDFENSGSLGADVSGNGNNFTVNNLTAIDQSSDSCTNNFATLNPLASLPNTGVSTFSEGNLVSQGVNGSYVNGGSTFQMTTGKWYAEVKYLATSSDVGRIIIGITQDVSEISRLNQDNGSLNTTYNNYDGAGGKNVQGTGSTYGSDFGLNDIIGIALDLDNEKLYFSVNGTWQNSGVPTSGSTGTGAITGFSSPSSSISGGYFFFSGSNSNAQNNTVSWNFGSPSFSISSGNTDGNGYGNFEYAVPSGYYALNTKNLAEYG